MELCSKLARNEKIFAKKQDSGIKSSCHHKHLQFVSIFLKSDLDITHICCNGEKKIME